jgi:hypothetical protein
MLVLHKTDGQCWLEELRLFSGRIRDSRCLPIANSAVICGGKLRPEDGPIGPKHFVINQILRHEQTDLKLYKDGR